MLETRSVEVISPVGGENIVLERMTGSETLGRPFEFTVDMLSTKRDIPISDALGKPLTVGLSMGMLGERFFNGVVARFSQIGLVGSQYRYRAKVRPWLWLLTRTANSRIFQHKTVLDVLSAVFEQHGFSAEVDDSNLHQGDYEQRDYLVQYNETDFNFVSRLMEQEGIYYYFRHDQDKHTLVLQSGPVGNAETVPGYEEIPYFDGSAEQAESIGHEHISAWSVGVQIEPMAVVVKEFDYENPGAALLSASRAATPGAESTYEIFQYPGLYIDSTQRDAYAARRLEEDQLGAQLARGMSNARGITPGKVFTLTDHDWGAQNASYLVTGATYAIEASDYESGAGGSPREFSCVFHAIDAAVTYRSPAISPKPRVEGPQTAIVVGPAGEEIWTDPDGYGCVMVQFHWDRLGTNDENSSCWVRVAQLWAGSGWGGIHIPRIGQEVIVDFLEGDPDRPIITGRVYNADNMPPYTLPDNQTQSGIKSRSSKGGAPSNFNELRFEDKKGSELVNVQAEKDLTSLVKHDEDRNVGNDRTTEIGHDETITVGNNRTESVAKQEQITIGGDRQESVAKSETVSIGSTRSLTVGTDETIQVGGKRTDSVAKDETTSVGGNQTLSVGKNQNVDVGGALTLSVAKDDNVSVTGNLTVSVGKGESRDIGKKLTISAGDQITLTSGSASITLKSNGDITINGANITLKGSGKITVQASSDVVIKGSKVSQN